MIQYIVAAGVGAILGGMSRKNKMAHGGMHRQGYDDKLDESLGMRKGAGRTKEQSRKDRRDESAGMEKSMGRRKYAAVDTMDVGNRMMEKGGKTQGFKPGDMWSEDFDYEGMIDFAENIDEKTSVKDLEKFADSAEDVNYHSLANPVQDYISSEQTDEDRKRMLKRLMRNLFTI